MRQVEYYTIKFDIKSIQYLIDCINVMQEKFIPPIKYNINLVKKISQFIAHDKLTP